MPDGFFKNYYTLLEEAEKRSLCQIYQVALKIISEGILAADPKIAIKKTVKIRNDEIYFSENLKEKVKKQTKIIVIGGGKATSEMAIAIEEIFQDRIACGYINVPDNIDFNEKSLKRIILNSAGHPFVTEGSIKGAKQILKLIENNTINDLVICLISGGGSALLELPYDWITLDELQKVYLLLTEVGATIYELNVVRKHLSQIKGGKLAKIAQPARVISLIISDVIGDDIDTIASGPTAPDKSTWYEMKTIIDKYKLENLPNSIYKTLNLGLMNDLADTCKPDNEFFNNVFNFIIASNKLSCEAMRKYGEKLGFQAKIITTSLTGEAKEIGVSFANQLLAETDDKVLLIAGGETTVTIKGKGKGGRNQEFALAASEIIKDHKNCLIIALGSDGIDGPTDSAGAIVDGFTSRKGAELGLIAQDFLQNNDSYHYLKKTKNLLFTGPTGTNVSDLIIGLKISKLE
ncbi:MAG: glycerate kinase [Candidatus Heimdallarchaeota archaeon]|nr:glycerate kinase [Candidatus Heimdallarchaeota archaeon]